MKDINQMLDEKSAVYGDFKGGCMTRHYIVDIINQRHRETHGGEDMPSLYLEFVWDIANKLSRIAVTPNHVDSWVDIAGYSSLIVHSLEYILSMAGEKEPNNAS